MTTTEEKIIMKKTISNKITIYNFIMTLFICCYHFRFWEFGSNSKFTSLREFSGTLAMQFFFLFSGFLLYFNANKLNIKEKVHKRFYSLFIPYIIWNIIAMIRYKCYKLTFSNLLSWFFTGPLNGPIWYLLAIYLLSLFAPLVIKLKNKKNLSIVLLCLSLIYLYLRGWVIPYIFYAESWWWYWNTIGYLPFYLIGCFAGLHLGEYITNKNYRPILYLISAITLIISIYIKYFTNIKFLSYFSFIANILICLSIWFVLPSNIFKTNLSILTQNSFFIYVTHVPFLIPTALKLLKLCFKGYYTTFWMFILIYILALGIMFLICWGFVTLLKLIFIKSNKTFMILSGNRVQNNFCKMLNRNKSQIGMADKNNLSKQHQIIDNELDNKNNLQS